jgi:predicted lipoprotein with Yx(FWY)xxD motif
MVVSLQFMSSKAEGRRKWDTSMKSMKSHSEVGSDLQYARVAKRWPPTASYRQDANQSDKTCVAREHKSMKDNMNNNAKLENICIYIYI